jgi:hypothetical protein
MERKENQKFEFLLTLNKNIICQRYFNVRNFNPKSVRSLDLYYTVSSIVDDIIDSLKGKTTDIISEFYKDEVSNLQGDGEYFTITVKKENTNIIQYIFPADLYPPRVKYSVDIRPQISYFLREITDTLSRKKLTTKYLDKQL